MPFMEGLDGTSRNHRMDTELEGMRFFQSPSSRRSLLCLHDQRRPIRPKRTRRKSFLVEQVSRRIVRPAVSYEHRSGNLRTGNHDLIPLDLRPGIDELFIFACDAESL